jgi:pyruvate dehydrogenase E1 component beta subunit
MMPIIVHPRIDFMLYGLDAIVNQAAKWSHMTGGQSHPAVTIRGIINRGGEQGAQHSQSLHSWFSHIPGLRVVMPSTVSDARDLLVASVLSLDPVVYLDDRWLYEQEEELGPVIELDLTREGPRYLLRGDDITVVGSSYSTLLAKEALAKLAEKGIIGELIDLRVLNPLNPDLIIESVKKTGRLLVVDGGWRNCGLGGEIISSVMEALPLGILKAMPKRISLPDAPAPCSRVLEEKYYPTTDSIVKEVISMML